MQSYLRLDSSISTPDATEPYKTESDAALRSAEDRFCTPRGRELLPAYEDRHGEFVYANGDRVQSQLFKQSIEKNRSRIGTPEMLANVRLQDWLAAVMFRTVVVTEVRYRAV